MIHQVFKKKFTPSKKTKAKRQYIISKPIDLMGQYQILEDKEVLVNNNSNLQECSSCGSKNDKESNKCFQCGSRLK